ncbi:PQQ-binding-like beta-propeller repeat protein [Candidatus Latescibacterota bacterium]
MKLNFLSKAIVILFIWNGLVFSDEWPDWRGSNRDGTWNETGVKKNFDSSQINIKWRMPISSGYSGPTVADKRVYITDRVKDPKDIERVMCFDSMTGKKIWSYSYNCTYGSVGYPNGPRASVIIDGDRAYSLGTMGHLFCFQNKTGKVIWNKDLKIEYDIKMPTWGISAAPLIVDNKLILNIGGRNNACIVALNKNTGKEIWKNLDDGASYSAPILIEQSNKPVVVIWTDRRVVGLNPNTGLIYWQQSFEQKQMVINIATPVFYNNYLFVSSFFDGSMLLKLNTTKLSVTKVWQRAGEDERNTDALHSCISTPLLKGDFIYGVDSYGELRCLELKSGDRIWEDLSAVKPNRWANIHFIQNGELTYMLNENGELIVGQLSPKGFQEISRSKLINPTVGQLNRSGTGVTWAHPAFAYKHVYIRNDNELICADLTEK